MGRDDRQTTLREAYELLVRQVRNRDRKLQVGPHRHARDGRELVRCRELRHARRGQRRVLVGCAFRFVVVAQGRRSLLTLLRLCFCSCVALGSDLVRILQRVEGSVLVPIHLNNSAGEQLTRLSPPRPASTNRSPPSVSSSQPKARPGRATWQLGLPP